MARIPQLGSVGSLNAAVSAGIVLYEAARQRRAGSGAWGGGAGSDRNGG
jgi:tRNA(Leu) C34 or U34 (ribose-2'-O)-methylase TrmL